MDLIAKVTFLASFPSRGFWFHFILLLTEPSSGQGIICEKEIFIYYTYKDNIQIKHGSFKAACNKLARVSQKLLCDMSVFAGANTPTNVKLQTLQH